MTNGGDVNGREMRRPAAVRRLARLSGANRRALVEAFVTLAAASVAIRLLPFRRTALLMAKRAVTKRATPVSQDATVNQCRWAVNAWADRVPWRAVCFQRGLALHLMLRRRGIVSVLQYGVAQDVAKGLQAHVWVEAGGRLVMGGENAADFRRVASFPAPQRT